MSPGITLGARAVNPGLTARIATARSLLSRIALVHSPAVFASSLGAEDMVITDMILTHSLGIGIFAIDTGRLHADTLQMLDAIRLHYGHEVQVERPDEKEVLNYIERNGRDGFYRSAELRKLCCHVRKVEPLRRALAGKRAWITGMRREQATSRAGLAVESFDAEHGLAKFNPLADWSEEDVWSYLRAHSVPYNPLYDQGYRSVGCAPCTRAVLPSEDPRAGRWWWESGSARECGLHVTADGRRVRATENAI